MLWNSGKEGKEKGMRHYKNFSKCHNAPPAQEEKRKGIETCCQVVMLSQQMPQLPSTDVSIQYLHHVHPPTPFAHILYPSHLYQTPDRACSALLFSDFVKERNDIFVCLR
jgi:hypothetical protein